jgi:2,3-bisphosphoglycerate-dependent phosphoglycerate mutase
VASFLLIRHAESPWSPDESRPLSPAGLAAADELAVRLSTLDLDAIYCSPYQRAQQTIAPLAKRLGLAVTTVTDLRERPFGEFAPATYADAARLAWQNLDSSWPGGESPRAAQERIVRFIEMLSASGPRQPLVLSTHGNLLALLLNSFDARVGFEFWNSLRFPDAFSLEVRGPGSARFSRI